MIFSFNSLKINTKQISEGVCKKIALTSSFQFKLVKIRIKAAMHSSSLMDFTFSIRHSRTAKTIGIGRRPEHSGQNGNFL